MTTSTLRARSAEHGRPGGEDADRPEALRRIVLAGARAAGVAAGVGLAALALLVLIGWVASPHLGIGLAEALRTAAVFWLAAQHAAVDVHAAGRIGMLPLGLVLLPGALLWRAGRVVVRGQRITDPGLALVAVLAIAAPYGLLAGVLAVVSRSALAAASWPQGLVAGFGVAFIAAGFGAARALRPWSRLAAKLPTRIRSVVAGMAAALALLAGAGAVTVALDLAGHLPGYGAVYRLLAPGVIGGGLLLLAQIAYLPNAVVWAIAYMLGPGFAVGTGTIVAPTGSALATLPAFPLLAAVPGGAHGSTSAWLTAVLMAIPYLAGAIGGLVTVRMSPVMTLESAPVRGFLTGAGTGLVLAVLAAFSGGPLGDGRLSAVGPSAWQVGLVGILEIGIAAAITAGVSNWLASRSSAPADAVRRSASAVEPTEPEPGEDSHVIYLDRWGTGDRPHAGPGGT